MTPNNSLSLNDTVQTIVIDIPSCSITCRSLWTIVSTCFLTIFACIYTAVHHNVPSPYDRQLRLILRAVWTIMLGLATPELIVVWAARQWVSAHYFTKEMNKCIADKKQATDKEKMRTQTRIKSLLLNTEEDESWTNSHSFYAYMGGFMIYHNGKPFSTITPRNLLRCLKDGHIGPIKLTKIEVDDCSKGNFISKALVVIQAAWFVIQLVARRVDEIAITPLEIGTAAFCVLCFVTIICWLDKPLNVQHPRRVDWKGPGAPPENLHTDSDDTDQGGDQERTMAPVRYVVRWLQRSNGNSVHRVETFGGDDIDFLRANSSSLELQKGSRNPSATLFAVGTSITLTFGLIHLAAWNFEFPSVLEQIAWRYSAVVLVCVPVCMTLMAVVRSSVGPFDGPFKFMSYFLATIFVGLAFAYVVGRILLIIIMLSTLRNLPPSSYETIPWAEAIPHI